MKTDSLLIIIILVCILGILGTIYIVRIEDDLKYYKEMSEIYEHKFRECLKHKPIINNSNYPMVIKNEN